MSALEIASRVAFFAWVASLFWKGFTRARDDRRQRSREGQLTDPLAPGVSPLRGSANPGGVMVQPSRILEVDQGEAETILSGLELVAEGDTPPDESGDTAKGLIAKVSALWSPEEWRAWRDARR